MLYVIPMSNEQVKLQVNDGRITAIIPNYTRVYPEAEGFKSTDGAVFVYTIEVRKDQLKIEKDGDAEKHLLWLGSHEGRFQTGDWVTVPIASLVELK